MIGGGGLNTAVILLDENGSIVDAHASCADTFGWQREELLGKDIKDLLQYGRDLLMTQLHLLEEDDSGGNTSFTVRVLAKRKDQQQFPARATIRRFQELQCWTVAFYRADAEPADSDVQPSVSAAEIALAKRALEEKNSGKRVLTKPKKAERDDKKGDKGDTMGVSRLWRNSRLLFGSRESKPGDLDAADAAEAAQEKRIVDEADSLAAQCLQAAPAEGPAASASEASAGPAPASATEKTVEPKSPPPVAAPAARTVTPEPAVPAVRVESTSSHALPSTSITAGDGLATVARLKAELEKERGERSRVEQRAASLSSQVQALHLQLSEGLNLERENQARLASLEQESREAQELLAKSTADLEAERAERRAGEDQLQVLRELNARLEDNVAVLENGRGSVEAAQAEFRTHLDRNQAALKETEAALDREKEARQRMEQSLNLAIREHRTLEQKLSAEVLRLQTALASSEISRSQAEKQALRARAEALQTASDARARANRFRQSFSHVLGHINGTTRELLQSPLTEEQKCVIEALLQDVISLESGLEKEGALPEGAGVPVV